jgi:hypothetical protein
MMPDQELLPPDLDRLAAQRAVVARAAQTRYGVLLPGGRADLPILQRLIDDHVFRPDETYELQSLGIVLGQALAHDSGLAWVTVRDEYGEDPALRYRNTSILVYPLTMISKRIEEGREVDVEGLYTTTLTRIGELAAEGY